MMQCLVTQDGASGLPVVGGIHVDGYQLDVYRQFIKHLHYLGFIGDDAAVHLGELRKDRSTAIHHDIVGLEPFYRFADAVFPFAIAHDINSRKPFGHQHIARNRSHHLAYLTETVMANSTVDGQMT